ncbi:hypothetical protein IAU59_001838 [Kwoniella sp. CBS 9459]
MSTSGPIPAAGPSSYAPSSIPASSLSPSPALILQALNAQLLPAPLYPQLGSSLQLIAHLYLLSEKIYKQAVHVLKLHKRLRRKLDEHGYGDKDKVLLGTLNEIEGNQVQEIVTAYEEEIMEGGTLLALSLELRQLYVAKLLSAPKMPLEKVKWMIDSYFPDISDTKVEVHQTLYIRCMRGYDIAIYENSRKAVLEWFAMAEERAKNQTPRLKWNELYPADNSNDNGSSRQRVLVDRILSAARQVSDDAQTLEEVFVRTNTGKVVVDDEFLERRRNRSKEKAMSAGMGNGTTFKAEEKASPDQPDDDVDDNNDLRNGNRRHTTGIFSSPAISPIRAQRAQRAQRASLPPTAPTPGSSPLTHSRLVVPPPLQHSQTYLAPLSTAGEGPSKPSRAAQGTISKALDHTKITDLKPASTHNQPFTPSSKSPNKHPRPRQSFPPAGPDYTASPPSAKRTHANWRSDDTDGPEWDLRERETRRLRPFEDSELKTHVLKRNGT